jgi:ribose 5-phosphate isomerase B
MIYLGSDHGGFDLKQTIMKWLSEHGFEYTDLGNTVHDSEDDYPEYAFLVAKKVAEEEKAGKKYPTSWKERAKGILLCRSAGGVVIAGNKVLGARVVPCYDAKQAEHARAHNDANVIALSGDWLEEHEIEPILKAFLETEFSGEDRHTRRLNQIREFELIER